MIVGHTYPGFNNSVQFTDFFLTVNYVPAPDEIFTENQKPFLENFPPTLIIQQCETDRAADFVFTIPDPVDPEGDPTFITVDLADSQNVMYNETSRQIIQKKYVSKPNNETLQITVTDSFGDLTEYELLL